jgi:hypothetical protein
MNQKKQGEKYDPFVASHGRATRLSKSGTAATRRGITKYSAQRVETNAFS